MFHSLVFGKSPVTLGKERRPRRRAFGAAARRCRSFQSRPAAAAALELLKFGSKSKATPKRLRQQLAVRRERRVAAGGTPASAWSAFFPHVSKDRGKQ